MFWRDNAKDTAKELQRRVDADRDAEEGRVRALELKRKRDDREQEDDKLKTLKELQILERIMNFQMRTGVDQTSLFQDLLGTEANLQKFIEYLGSSESIRDYGIPEMAGVYEAAAKIMQLMEKTARLK